MKRHMFRSAVITMAILALTASPAFAASTTEQSKVTAAVNTGSTYGFVDGYGDPALPTVTLTGAAQTLTGLVATNSDKFLTVVDDRGSGLGWSVTAQCTTLQVDAAPAKAFARNSITMSTWSAGQADPGSSPVTGWTMPTGAVVDSPTGVVMMSTGAGSGMGTYAVSIPNNGWGLAVTADEFAGSYTSTLTLTWASL